MDDRGGTFGDRRLPIVGWSDDQELAGPDAAGFLRQHALEQRDRLACSRVANPAIGGHARQTFGRGQQSQVSRLGAEMRHVHGRSPLLNDVERSRHDGFHHIRNNYRVRRLCRRRCYRWRCGGLLWGGGPAHAISPRRPGQPRRIAFGRAHLLDRREQRRFIHRASVPEPQAPPRKVMLPK